MTALEVKDARLAVAGRRLIDGLSFRVEAGAALTIMGPSGAGKSALLAFIAGHLDPAFTASGSVRLGGRDLGGLPAERRGVGLLFQDDLLFPHLSVGANVAFGLRGRSARRARVAEALAEAGLAGFEDRDPATLSGGQRARVALMRSLVATQRRVVFERAAGLPVVLVTHEPADAQGAVIQLGAVA